jgi:uncharacterized membrane protein YqgA involved in biofilm formation
MVGLGTIINVIAIILGGLIGNFLKKDIPKKIQDAMMTSIGLCILFIGITGVVNIINKVNNYTLIMIVSLIVGTILGEFIDFDEKFTNFGEKLKEKTNNKKDKDFLKGFLTNSFTVAIGAMAIIGSIKDGMQGDYSVLFAKSILDFIPVFIFEGTMSVIAYFVGPFLIQNAINNLSLIGSMLIFVVGINLMFNKKIKIANMLPSLLIAIIWAYII